MDWTQEMECFDGISRELSLLFAAEAPIVLSQKTESKNEEDPLAEFSWMVEHTLFPAFRAHLICPKRIIEQRIVVQVANLPDLYKVFERC